jgi:hypothetical protein
MFVGACRFAPALIRVVLATAVVGGSSVGCALDLTDERAVVSHGSLSLQLRATSGDAVYRLWPAEFTVTSLDDETRPAESLTGGRDHLSLQLDVPTGAYDVALLDGWHLERLESDGVFRRLPVSDRMLLSEQTQNIEIDEHQVTNVVFQFLVGDNLILFNEGRIGVSVDVVDCETIDDPACPDEASE